MPKLLVIGFSFGYLALLFGVAYAAERRSAARKSLVSNPYVYALSMAVYCTAWTYYGSVGRAAHNGLEFVGIYLGPTLLAPVWWLVLRKIIRVSRQQRLTSIADFISARYGKSAALGALVTVVCVLGIVPYIALQIKAIAASFVTLTGSGAGAGGAAATTALYTTGALAVFTILFGVRSVEATERHEGIVLAVALESVLKLVAFLILGLFVTFGLFHGFADVFDQSAAVPALRQLFTLRGSGTSGGEWFTLLVLSMSAVLLLPRQFQVAVVENVDENHLRKAMWLFPLYLIVINLFVLPVAFSGMLRLGHSGIDADTFVLALPLAAGHSWLALLTYLGGLSAASSMIIVETVALSVMMSNHLLMPLLVRVPVARPEGGQTRWFAYLGRVALESRRLAVVLVLLLAYGYYAEVGKTLPLVNTGLVSFAAVAQFVPAVLGGLYWKGGSRRGATVGLLAGFAIWFFTLVLPTLVGPGRLPESVLTDGVGGLSGLRPFALFGLEGLGYLSHGLFWSWFFNIGLYVGLSLAWPPMALELRQADVFVDVFTRRSLAEEVAGWQGRTPFPDVRALLLGFLGKKRTNQALRTFATRFPDALPAPESELTPSLSYAATAPADPRLLTYAEKLLAGSLGPASARMLVASVAGAEQISYDSVVGILKESQQLLEANRQLQKQSRQLQRLTDELRAAYDQLQALDHRKDEFLYTVTHELRTPLTSIRALAEILADNPDLETEERQHFQLTIGREAERLTRLISLVLDLEKFESGQATLDRAPVPVVDLVAEALDAVGQLLRDKHIALHTDVPANLPALHADRDRLMQVLVNLLSNAIKACRSDGTGRIAVLAWPTADVLLLCVEDNGRGISPAAQHLIFDKFYQAQHQTTRKPEGTGLGLAITRKIVELHHGRIWVESSLEQGARFFIELPLMGSGEWEAGSGPPGRHASLRSA
ncbi:GHKL domain-containing protein [Microvirga sp. STS02]|uniref:sensor histidine kinase n=1 Tax=Hymenobacter negativus TaxID=2795026 RepID=UPI0018DBCC9B|nr:MULTISPECIES: sensor histidine kinase [Bacteria]MBH8569448.1 GHKL domain-containing protein [Hymenobacter negativus]MBR7209184.1 GHKL domain-containing protein [Microvirga sp. STS02]